MKTKFCIFLIASGCVSSPLSTRSPNSESLNATPPTPDMILDTELGEEYEGGSFEKENKIIQTVIANSKELMEKMYQENGRRIMTRDAHAKSHGCLTAKFSIDNSNLPIEHRAGIFGENRTYDAIVRFSNNDQFPVRADNQLDLRGMAIKILGIEGPKILPGYESATTQDFLMYGSKVFFVKDNADYIDFIAGLRDGNATTVLLTQQPSAAISVFKAQSAVKDFTNPANMTYFSAVPVRLGKMTDRNRTAMKYRTTPCDPSHPFASLIKKNGENYMKVNLIDTLRNHEVCFNFQVQLRPEEHRYWMPIEDATVEWPEYAIGGYGNQSSPYLTVAKVIIAPQKFDTEARRNYCENLSFSPWHTLEDHKPLGRTMRMRRDIYKETSLLRRTRNHADLSEPTELPTN